MKKRISHKRSVKKWNKELKAYQLKVLGFTTGEAVGDILKAIEKKKSKVKFTQIKIINNV